MSGASALTGLSFCQVHKFDGEVGKDGLLPSPAGMVVFFFGYLQLDVTGGEGRGQCIPRVEALRRGHRCDASVFDGEAGQMEVSATHTILKSYLCLLAGVCACVCVCVDVCVCVCVAVVCLFVCVGGLGFGRQLKKMRLITSNARQVLRFSENSLNHSACNTIAWQIRCCVSAFPHANRGGDTQRRS